MSPHQNAVDAAIANAVKGSGVVPGGPVHSNLVASELITHALRREEGRLSAEGGFIVETGVHTGRSVADKFTVDDAAVTADVWWRMGNQKLPPERFEVLKGASAGVSARTGIVHPRLTCWRRSGAPGPGAAGEFRGLADVVCAEHVHSTERGGAGRIRPDYVILHAPKFQADPAIDGVRSSTAIAVSLTQKMIVIAGSEYGGEIKKSIFGIMNWLLPARGVLPMHCSANASRETGEVALFFGLSGRGRRR